MALPAFSFPFRNGEQRKAQRAAATPLPFGLRRTGMFCLRRMRTPGGARRLCRGAHGARGGPPLSITAGRAHRARRPGVAGGGLSACMRAGTHSREGRRGGAGRALLPAQKKGGVQL